MYLGIEFLGHNVLSCTMCLVMSDSVTPWTGTTRLFCPWDSLGKNTGVGSHCLLQGGSQWLELKHAGWGLHVGGHEGPHVMLQLREEWEGRKGSLGMRVPLRQRYKSWCLDGNSSLFLGYTVDILFDLPFNLNVL